MSTEDRQLIRRAFADGDEEALEVMFKTNPARLLYMD